MDFVTHLPRTLQGHDALWVIVDRLTKSVHFLAMRMTFTLERFCQLYIREIVQLHGVPVSIVLDRDPRFTAHFWKSFQKAMGTRLNIAQNRTGKLSEHSSTLNEFLSPKGSEFG